MLYFRDGGSQMFKRRELVMAACGVVLALGGFAFEAWAETWNLGPWVRPLHQVFGASTWPLVTTVVVGLPIAAMFYAAARFTQPASALHLAILVGPFAALQMARLAGAPGAWTLSYALMFTATATAGALAWKAASRKGASSR